MTRFVFVTQIHFIVSLWLQRFTNLLSIVRSGKGISIQQGYLDYILSDYNVKFYSSLYKKVSYYSLSYLFLATGQYRLYQYLPNFQTAYHFCSQFRCMFLDFGDCCTIVTCDDPAGMRVSLPLRFYFENCSALL